MQEIELVGLDGGNLLGYMAALGTLRVLSLAEPEAEVRMSWVEKGCWRPIIHHSRGSNSEELISSIESSVCGAIDPAWEIGDDLRLSADNFRKCLLAQAQSATPAYRSSADFLSAFGSDVFGDHSKNDKIPDTELRAVGGGNKQNFLAFMREIHHETTTSHLHQALFADWEYSDSGKFMRWDPNEYRPHALRAIAPADDREHTTVRGANRLALEALPLFPTVPLARRLRTTSFGKGNGEPEMTWPIWADALDVSTVASLMASAQIQKPDGRLLARRGIVQLYRARRLTDGNYRNFTPARALL